MPTMKMSNEVGNSSLCFHVGSLYAYIPMALTVDSKGKQERMNENSYAKVSKL